MKRKDLGLIAVVIIFSSVFALIVIRMFFGTPAKYEMSASKVEAITSDFQEPSKKYFNENSVDPTRTIKIGDDNPNKQPFDE